MVVNMTEVELNSTEKENKIEKPKEFNETMNGKSTESVVEGVESMDVILIPSDEVINSGVFNDSSDIYQTYNGHLSDNQVEPSENPMNDNHSKKRERTLDSVDNNELTCDDSVPNHLKSARCDRNDSPSSNKNDETFPNVIPVAIPTLDVLFQKASTEGSSSDGAREDIVEFLRQEYQTNAKNNEASSQKILSCVEQYVQHMKKEKDSQDATLFLLSEADKMQKARIKELEEDLAKNTSLVEEYVLKMKNLQAKFDMQKDMLSDLKTFRNQSREANDRNTDFEQSMFIHDDLMALYLQKNGENKIYQDYLKEKNMIEGNSESACE